MLQNVQPDFNETNVNSDAYIKNAGKKLDAPSVAGTAGQVLTKTASSVEWADIADPLDYLCFTIAKVTGSNPSLSLSELGSPSSVSLEYSHDKQTWTAYTIGGNLLANKATGDKVWIRGNNSAFSTDDGNRYYFTASNLLLDCSGNCLSLLAKDCSATEIPSYGFWFLFSGDGNTDNQWLLSAPEIPATTVNTGACGGMFRNCKQLVHSMKVLPATTFGEGNEYATMFQGCGRLVDAPALPATTLTAGCYSSMFNGCRSLLVAPDLPATTLPNQSPYLNMFNGCWSLVKAPALPATTVPASAYKNMFYNCYSLEKGPTISATTVGESGMEGMFYYCSSLTVIPNLQITSVGVNGCKQMFANCVQLIQAPALPATTLGNYCYMEMFCFCRSLRGAPALPAETLAEGCYQSMFENCQGLVYPQDTLPATTVPASAYKKMFRSCTTMLRTPNMDAMTSVGANGCQAMYQNCYNMKQAPSILKPTTLTAGCYSTMFEDCTSLTEMPELPATTLDASCYSSMFAASGIKQTVNLPATTLAQNCYQSMFENCPNLEVAHRILATTLATNGMTDMFKGCPSLKHIRVDFPTWDTSCTSNWVANSGDPNYKGVFVCLSSLADTRGDSNIPTGWTKTTIASYPNMNSTSGTWLTTTATEFTVTPSANEKTCRVVVDSTLTLNAVNWGGYAYAEIVLDVPTGSSVTAGSGITLVDEPAAGKRNVCIVRWDSQTAKLYVVIEEDIPQA